ncbi:aminoacyl-tRNA hydrolase [Microaerobacter geothermalis]|uniref:aminoacyl-tRNA hydrolase n=1 Tax=Microaerobacter geothermalis TaxID=674972 RepID=UPI001F26ED38|nr:aminoacyl-tRNA hydrolase [Microaerobacter geothermalis]MCF6094699.1 aminoacyl-tRNA hydrolase [Microaerobacter geothermalis]
MKLIAGLGNPGSEYEKTRHNIGFRVVDYISQQVGIPLSKNKFKGVYGMGLVETEKLILLKPMTYMNLSGDSIKEAIHFFDVPIEQLLVIYDDLDLPVGKIRLREKGSSGGHNGLKSIISHLHSDEFKRIRIGIGKPMPGIDVADYVLSPFQKDEREQIEKAIQRAGEAAMDWIHKPFVQVMNGYNG